MANDQSINSKNGNSSSASTPTTSDRPTQTRLPSMRDLLQDVNPTTNRNPISSHHLHHSNTHHHQTLASSERSTINHRPPSSDDSSSMALDDYPDHVEVADADRRVPSGPGKEIVENWTRTQRLGNDGFNHAATSYITSHEASPRRTSGELDVGRVEPSRDAGQAGAAHEWTSVAPPKRSEVAKGGGQYHQQPSYHQGSYPSRSPRQMENPLAPSSSSSRHSHQLATFGAPLSHNQQQVQVQSHSNMLPPVPPGFSSRSRERASTLSIPRPEILQEYPAARFSPTYPPGHPSNQAQLAAHLRQAPGSRESVGSASTAATGRSSLLNSNQYGGGYGYAQGRQWEEHRSRSDSSSSMTTNRSSISAISPSFKYGHLQGTEMSPKDAYFTNHQMQPINSSPLLFAPLSPKDQPSTLSPQVTAKGYPAVLASPSHASRSENGDHFSSGSSSSYPPSPVSPMFIDGQVNYHPMSTSVPHHGVRGGVRRSWDQTSLRALVSPSGPHPQLPSTTTRHGWTSQSPISQVSGLPSTTGYSSTIPQAPYSAPGGNASGSSSSVSHPSPPVPALSLPPAPERLAHSRRRRKPPASYAYLITQAISSSPTGQMSLKEIYSWISQAHPNHYSLEGDSQGWTNVVRHNLSLNKAFVKVPKHEESGPVKSGKGGLWTLDRAIIEQRANTGQGAGIGLSAALAAGDAIREARAQGRDLPIGSGSSEDNDDQMSIDEATPSPRLSHQDLPFPTAMGPGSTRNLTERSSTATLRGSDPENRNLTRRRSKSHMGTDIGSHSQAPVSPSVLGGPTTPTFSSTGILPPFRHSTSTESPPSTSTINRRIAGRPRGHTISNGEIAKQRRTNPPPNATVLQSPSKRKTLDSIEVDPEFQGQSRSTRNIKIRNPTASNSSPSSSVTPLPTNQLQVKSYSSTHHHPRNLKVMINNSVHQREDGMQDDDAEFTRPTKSPKLSTDLQSLAVEDKDEEARLRHSVTPTQGQDDEREGQSMKISGLLC